MPSPAEAGPAAELPIAVGRYHQAHAGERLPLQNGGWTKGGKLYLVGIFEPTGAAVACAGPFRTEQAVEEALRTIPLRGDPLRE